MGAPIPDNDKPHFQQIIYHSVEYHQALQLREHVLRIPLGLTLSDVDIQQEQQQLHFGLFNPSAVLIACVTAAPLTQQQAKIRQMAVSPTYQNRGLGHYLLQHTESRLRNKGFTQLVLHARTTVIPFYEKCGYSTTSSVFIVSTILHIEMSKKLALVC